MVTLHTTLSGKRVDLASVRELVAELERSHALPQAVVFDLNVVLDEVLSNIVQYGYAADAAHDINVSLRASDAAIEVAIDDDGRAFDPSSQAEPDLSLPFERRPIGGLGLHFVRQLMDEVDYKRENNRNYLILKKKLKR